MQKVTVKDGPKLSDYLAYSSLKASVENFQESVPEYMEALKGKTIWMVNSTATGGGVAEMLPSQMRILRSFGIRIEWLVIQTNDKAFFTITKRIHNAIHGSGEAQFTAEERKIYESVNQQNLEGALQHIKDGDILVIHDPQPMPLAGMIRKHRKVRTIWRCHIGLESENDATRSVWKFLSAYFTDYDRFVFSLKAYVLKDLAARTALIPPAIDPLSHKNRTLQINKNINILVQAGIMESRKPHLFHPYNHQARRIMPDGTFDQVNKSSHLDIGYRPFLTEISRWDRLKGFKELMEAFVWMKKENEKISDKESIAYKRIKFTRLILGGPDPKFVTDDPEGLEVLQELSAFYQELSPDMQQDIALLLLPLDNPKENALIVNALQRMSSVVVQNSIQEGFGLTATEAMWKQTPVLVSGAAGLKFQVEHEKTGLINEDPTDIKSLADAMVYMLNNPKERDKWGFNAQTRVVEHFTLFSQLQSWLKLFHNLCQE